MRARAAREPRGGWTARASSHDPFDEIDVREESAMLLNRRRARGAHSVLLDLYGYGSGTAHGSWHPPVDRASARHQGGRRRTVGAGVARSAIREVLHHDGERETGLDARAAAVVVRDGAQSDEEHGRGGRERSIRAGYLALRHGPFLERAVRGLNVAPDVLLVNAERTWIVPGVPGWHYISARSSRCRPTA